MGFMQKRVLTACICLFLWLAGLPAAAQTVATDESAAVILVYHRIGEDEYPENNIRQEQFASHIRELASGEYNVMSLASIADALKKGEKLPPRTVAITFDGGHKSILDNAVPLLKRHELPFTVFVSTDYAGRHTDDYLDWDDIKDLKHDKLATVGIHPAAYIRLYNEPEAEIVRQINKARSIYREQLGEEPTLFAYPFGEYSKAYRDLIEAQGFAAAFGQQSGVASAGTDLYSLPRFSMTETHAGLDRFRLTAGALPLPVTDIEPRDPVLHTARPSIGFTVEKELEGQLANLTCFVSGQGKPGIEIIGNRVELRLEKDFESDRARVNCTLPLPTGENYEEPRWRWFGMMLIPPKTTNQSWNAAAQYGPVQADG